MVNSQSRSAVIYVWDNDQQKLVALYRAVRPQDLGRECAAGFTGYFTLERLDEFIASLYKTHEFRRFTVRDWLASSIEDFHLTRFGWTKEDFNNFGPKVQSGAADAPEPVRAVGGLKWEMQSLEFFGNSIGMPVGLPKDKSRIIAAMKDDLEHARQTLLAELREGGVDTNDQAKLDEALRRIKEQGGRIFDRAEDSVSDWFKLSAPDRIGALGLLDHYLDDRGDRFLEAAIPHRDKDLYEALQDSYGNKIKFRLHADPDEPRYYFQLSEKEEMISEWWIGAHQDELVRAFGSLDA